MMLLVETTGEFSLIETETGVQIHRKRATVVPQTNFVSARLSVGQLNLLLQLSDDATDAIWVEHLEACAGNLQMALDSFDAIYAHDPRRRAAELQPRKGKAKGKPSTADLPELIEPAGTEIKIPADGDNSQSPG